MPPAARLRAARDFARIYRHGSQLRSGFFRLTWQINRFQTARNAIVISRKFSKRAVVRNRLKRQVRGIIRELLPRLQHVDFILQILPQQHEVPYETLRKELATLLERAKILAS